MRKIVVISVIVILLLELSMITALCAETKEIERAVPDSAREIIGDVDNSNAESALDTIMRYVKEKAKSVLSDALRNGAAVMLVPVICSLFGAMYGEKLPDVITIVGTLAVSALCLTGTSSFINLGAEMLDDLDAFSKVLLPTLTAAAASSGAITSAASKYAVAALFINILMSLSQKVILPLIYAFLAVSIGGAAFGEGLEAAAKLVKWAVGTVMTLTVLTFTIYLTVTGVISGAADAASIRLAKTTMSTAFPVVGGIISDAAAAVAGGTAMLKSTIGVFGMIVVIAVCIMPFLRLGVSYLVFKGASSLAQPIGGERLSKIIGAMGTAMGMMMGMCGSMAVMLYISIIAIMKVVT